VEDRSADAEQVSKNIVVVGRETVHTHNTGVDAVSIEPVKEYDIGREVKFVHELMRTGELKLVDWVELLQELSEHPMKPVPEPMTNTAVIRE